MNLKLTLVGLAAVVAVAATVAPPSRVHRPSDLRPLLLRPSLARTMSRSQLPLLIDLYWLRVINAIGEKDSEQKNRALYEYGVILTELDPRFYHAYVHIGLNIPFLKGFQPPLSQGHYANADLAEDMFRRGLKAFPDNMRMHIYLGWVLFGMQRKYAEAAEVYRHAATLPGAWAYMAPLATRLLAQAGRPEDAMEVAKELIANSEDESVKEELTGRLKELEVEALLRQVDEAVDRFTAREQRAPSSIEDLVHAGDYTGPLEDSLGGRLYLDDMRRPVSTTLPRRLEVYE